MTNFTEKPSPAVLEQFANTCMHATLERPFLASLGIYVFKKEALESLLASDASGMPPAHFGHDVLPAAISQGLDVRSHFHRGFWKVRVRVVACCCQPQCRMCPVCGTFTMPTCCWLGPRRRFAWGRSTGRLPMAPPCPRPGFTTAASTTCCSAMLSCSRYLL